MTSIPKFLTYTPEPLDLGDEDRRFPRRHVFQQEDVHAINAALASGRPLLLRGRPGTGKSQLALAAAVFLNRAFVSQVIDARTESRDLLWRFDAVRRLADAQVLATGRLEEQRKEWLTATNNDVLHESFYTKPGPLWWAFQWQTAAERARRAEVEVPRVRPGCHPEHGVVVLLDEIDKADSALPNGLLGALGDGEFTVPGFGRVICQGVEPLVVITTNEERSLPDAFLRRCAVHELELDRDAEALKDWLVRLGRAHYQKLKEGPDLDDTVLVEAADMVLADREICQRQSLHPPGSAEYLDLLRVVAERSKSEGKSAKKYLELARRFLLGKGRTGEASRPEPRQP